MVSMVIGVTLLLGLSTMYQLSGQTSLQISNSSDIYSSGLQAIDYLRANIKYAGANFIFPPPLTTQNYDDGGTNWVMPGWTYIGYYYDSYYTPFYPRMLPFYFSQIDVNAGLIQCINYSASDPQYFGIQQYQGQKFLAECWVADNAADKNNFFNNYGIDVNGSVSNICPDNIHNCGGWWHNDVYQRLIPHVVVQTNPNNAAAGDSISITFAVRATGLMDCLGNVIPGPSAGGTNVPVLVNDVFQVSTNNTLQCQTRSQTNGVWTTMSAWTDIVPNIEHMRVMVGMSDAVGNWTAYASNNRYAMPTDTNPPSSPTYVPLYTPPNPNTFIDINRIVSVRISLVARSTQNVLPSATATTMTLFNRPTSVQYTSTKDRLQRKLFTTTIFLENFIPPPYPGHCVKAPSSGQYYIKTSGIPWVNSASSYDTCAGPIWNANCAYFPTFDQCEASRNYWINMNYSSAVPN
jgi:hypothetical protein